MADQKKCIYGYVLPDKCQGIDREKGCPCGDYPSREELEGKCHAIWLLNGGETSEWNGDSCGCDYIQGNLNCKLNPF